MSIIRKRSLWPADDYPRSPAALSLHITTSINDSNLALCRLSVTMTRMNNHKRFARRIADLN
jgi:hypothetical protein